VSFGGDIYTEKTMSQMPDEYDLLITEAPARGEKAERAAAFSGYASPIVADVEGRPALELRDEDREVLAELLAEILVDVVERQLQEPA
jgi:hypothetical protein